LDVRLWFSLATVTIGCEVTVFVSLKQLDVRLRCSLSSDTIGCELFHETANKISTDIKEGVFLEQMVEYKLQKKDCAPGHLNQIDRSALRSGYISKVPCNTGMPVFLLFNAL
jgi:hypothetical protein